MLWEEHVERHVLWTPWETKSATWSKFKALSSTPVPCSLNTSFFLPYCRQSFSRTWVRWELVVYLCGEVYCRRKNPSPSLWARKIPGKDSNWLCFAHGAILRPVTGPVGAGFLILPAFLQIQLFNVLTHLLYCFPRHLISVSYHFSFYFLPF